MLETSFHELGFNVTPLLSFVMRQGPFSWKSPIMLELPGCHIQGEPSTNEGQLQDTYAPIQPNGKRSCIGVVACRKEPEPEKQLDQYLSPPVRLNTNHILSFEVRSPYPDAWYTPGVVSQTPLFSTTRSLPGVVAAGTRSATLNLSPATTSVPPITPLTTGI